MPSPVSTCVVAVTMLTTAGIEIGSRSSGSISSRLRVRIDMAAKNVPFTTSAHVPSNAINSQLPERPHRAQIVKDHKQRGHQAFQQTH